jgi:hypothetical protein
MSMQTERYKTRDRSYGVWHRVRSIARFLGTKQACGLAMADLDSILFAEYNFPDKLPLCLIEAARDVGQEKSAAMVSNLARMAGIPAYIALYTPAAQANPSNQDWPDIAHFRIKRIWPRPEPAWRTLTPNQWADALIQIREWQLRRFRAVDAANDSTY